MSTAEKQAPVKFKPVTLQMQFGNVSFGDEVASIGYKIPLEEIDDKSGEPPVSRAYNLLCNRQLKAVLTLGKRRDGETQGRLIKGDIEITGTFDTGNISVSTKAISGKLSLAIKEHDLKEFPLFSKRGGIVKITSAMEQILVDDEDEEGDPDENDAARPMLNGGDEADEAETPKGRKKKAK